MKLVVIQGKVIAVYEDRKMVAVFVSDADDHCDADVIEALRCEDFGVIG